MQVSINSCKLFFDVYGAKLKILPTLVKEKPTLIVLHGGHGLADHTLYVSFWSQFSDIAQVIFLDQRGCGRSDPADSSQWNLKQWGEDVFQFCQTLGIEKPIVAGVSFGGHVVCEYAKQHPNHPGGLIFCNTEAKFSLDDMCEVFEVLGGKKIAEIAREHYTKPSLETARIYKEKCIPYYAKKPYLATEIARCKQHLEVFTFYSKNEATQINYLKDLHTITCPTLLMAGTNCPPHPLKWAEAMAAHIDKKLVTLHQFKDAGAPVYNDSPEESYQVVKDFLSQFI